MLQIFSAYSSESVKVLYAETNNISSFNIINELPLSDIQFLEKISNPTKKAQSAVARLLAQKHLVDLGYNYQGVVKPDRQRPYLLCGCNIDVSIAHSRNIAAVAFANRPIGLDIEALAPKAFALRKKYLSESEIDCFAYNEQLAVEMWSIKEAIFKLAPEWIHSFVRDIVILKKDENSFEAIVNNKRIIGNLFQVNPSIIGAVCQFSSI